MDKIIGIDIGGTKISVVLGNIKGKILYKIRFLTRVKERGYKQILNEIIKSVETVITKTNKSEIYGIGISCGGPLDTKKGLILSPPNLPGWNRVPIVKILKNKFKIPVFIENDANAGALAEHRFGVAKGLDNIVFLTMGTGIGAGLILNGKLYTGKNDLAGEIGHIRITDDKDIKAYGKEGSFEAYCCGPGLERISKMMDPNSKLTAKEITELAFNRNKFALEVVNKCGYYLGKGLSIIVDILNPEMIIIGGMAVRLKDLILEPARKIVKKEALKISADNCKIVPSQLGESIGDIASICVVIEKL